MGRLVGNKCGVASLHETQQNASLHTKPYCCSMTNPVQVVRFREDHGPAMKYIPAVQALRNDPTALVIVVDDDKV